MAFIGDAAPRVVRIPLYNGDVAGGALAGTYPNPTIATGSIGTDQIATGAIGSDEIAVNAVNQIHVLNGYVDLFTNQVVSGVKTFHYAQVTNYPNALDDVLNKRFWDRQVISGAGYTNLIVSGTAGFVQKFLQINPVPAFTNTIIYDADNKLSFGYGDNVGSERFTFSGNITIIDGKLLGNAIISGNAIASETILQGHVANGYVDLYTNQIVSGTKYFQSLQTNYPINDPDVATKEYVDSHTISSGSVLYSNATATPVTLGGIPAGSTFSNRTMSQMWDALLYPYQYPAFSSFAITGETSPMEVGDTIPASVTFTWTTTNPSNIVANSINIYDITDALTLATGLANTGSDALVMPSPVQRVTAGSHVFQIEGQNNLPANFSSNLTFNWRWREYYGNSSNATLTEIQIEALTSSALTTTIAGTYSMGAGGYKYICISDAVGGQINTVKDSATNLSVPFATSTDDASYSNVDGGGYSYALVSVTNSYGVTNNYRVYRTKNSLGGSITLIVT